MHLLQKTETCTLYFSNISCVNMPLTNVYWSSTILFLIWLYCTIKSLYYCITPPPQKKFNITIIYQPWIDLLSKYHHQLTTYSQHPSFFSDNPDTTPIMLFARQNFSLNGKRPFCHLQRSQTVSVLRRGSFHEISETSGRASTNAH